MYKDVRVIRRPVNTSRRKRTVNIATTYLPLVPVTGKPVSTKTIVCHRHVGGGVVIVALDPRNRPIRAWSDTRDYQPIRCSYIESYKMRSLVFDRLKPERLYANCGEPLAPIPSLYADRLTVYDDGLDRLLARLIVDNTDDDNKDDDSDDANNAARPTYDEIRQLDPTITPSEYRKIYDL